MFINPQDVTVL